MNVFNSVKATELNASKNIFGLCSGNTFIFLTSQSALIILSPAASHSLLKV